MRATRAAQPHPACSFMPPISAIAPAARHPWPGQAMAAAWRRFVRWLGRRRVPLRALGLVLAAVAVLVSAPRAWDSERMATAARQAGPRAVSALPALQRLLQQGRGADEDAWLAEVNQFFNRRVLFRDDAEVWGQADHWASPLEMLEKGAGDCEDYAIGKYFSLLAMGMPVAKLRLVYVRAQMGGTAGPVQAHMVLAYYASPGAEPLVLDNLVGDIRPASRRPDLTPVFSFNSEGLWQGTQGASAGESTARLSRWREVLEKARKEGFL